MKFFYLVIFLLTGCAATISDYRTETPVMDLRVFFNGKVKAHGMFQDIHGKVTRRFTVDLTGTWQGDDGTFDEQFIFQDGEKQSRVWHLHRVDDQHYTGTAGDVIGVAQGELAGNALRWNYTLRVPVDGSEYDFQFDDWMIQLDEKHMFNKAKMSKLGITVGEITLFFEKLEN